MRNNNHLKLLFQLLLLLCCHNSRHDWLHPNSSSSSSTLLVDAVLRGDEQFAEIGGGRFWVFTSRGIHVIDPEECTVEHTIKSDANGQPLPSQWSEGVYMEYTNPNSNSNNPLVSNESNKKGFILINSGENFQGKNGQSDGLKSEVIVIDTNSGSKQPVHARIEVGPALGHAYSVFHRNQFWTHSDAEGYFYIVDLKESVLSLNGHAVKVKMDQAHHGDLMWDESHSNFGYATSTGEPHLFIIDMEQHKETKPYDFTQDSKGACTGAASMAYSKINKHLYVECYPSGGTLEYDVSFPDAPALVEHHTHIGGVLYETADQMYVTATDKGAGLLTFFAPGKTAEISTDPQRVKVHGHPEHPLFYYNSKSRDHVACMPQTQMTNAALLNPSTREPTCDYFNGCSPAMNADDVQNGVCRYRMNGNNTADGRPQGPLLSVPKKELPIIRDQESPWNQGFCRKCEFEANYQGPSERCICTPECGSCARDEYPKSRDNVLLKNTGIMCINVKQVILGMNHKPELIPFAGAIKHKPAQETQCGFVEPTRPHRLGGGPNGEGAIYDASISTVPNNAVVIVNIQVMSEKCYVEVDGEPQQIVYVPSALNYKSSRSRGITQGAAVGISVGLIIAAIAFCIVCLSCCCRSGQQHPVQEDIEKNSLEMPNRIPGEEYHDNSNSGHDEEGNFVVGQQSSVSYHDDPEESGIFT